MRRASAPALSLVLFLSVLGCGGHDGNPPSSCSVTLPPACPDPAAPTSFAHDVAPIFASVCATCHTPGKQMGTVPLDNYSQIYSRRGTILNQIFTCLMPPIDGPQATNDQLMTIVNWLMCDAPEN
jgi:mono/diheme cytochrome c family protein